MPYGFLCVAALEPRLRGAALRSASPPARRSSSRCVLEAAQSYLPARVAVNLDVLCNLAGAVLGAALGAALVPRWMRRDRSAGRAPRSSCRALDIDIGLVLVGLWLFTQLNPATLLFAAGDLRDLVAAAPARARRPEFFVGIEAFTAAANLIGVGLLVSALTRPGQPVRALICALVGVALVVKIAAFAVLMRAEDVLAWLTPGGAVRPAARAAVATLFAVSDAAHRAPRRRRGAAHGRDGARQPRAAQSLSRRDAQALAAGALPQLQRPDAPGQRALAVRRARLSDLPRSPAARCPDG